MGFKVNDEDIEELIKEFLANIAKKNKEELDVELSISYVYHVLKDNSRTHNNLPIQPAYL